jgi:predicted dehydrogenase
MSTRAPGDGSPVRFVVLGAGSIGRRHMANAVALGHAVVAVHDPDAARLAEARRVVGAGTLLTTREDEALAVEADAVLVCSPTAAHVGQARAAVGQGRHVLIEKPISHTLEGVDALVAEAMAARRAVLVGCNLHFLPSLQLVKRLLAEGRIGAPLSARAHCGYYLPHWRPQTDYRRGYAARQATGGGIILDSIHEFDYLRWLLGEPREVFCYAGRLSTLEIDTEDTAYILLRFDYGAVANLHLDYLQRTFRRSCELIGEDGVIVWDYISNLVRVYGKEDRHSEDYGRSINFELNVMYVDELRHFVECIEGRTTAELDAAGGRSVLGIALVAKRAAADGRPVRLAS